MTMKRTFKCLSCRKTITQDLKGQGTCKCGKASVCEDKFGFYTSKGNTVTEREYEFLTMFDEVKDENKD